MQDIIEKALIVIQNEFYNESSGHDWWHIYRVWQLAKYISEQEIKETNLVELIALFHDYFDHKLFTHEQQNHRKDFVKNWLIENNLSKEQSEKIINEIDSLGYKGSHVADEKLSIEGTIVRDADRLDAMGAIGIARAFTFGGYMNRPIYDPNITPENHHTYKEYLNYTDKGTTINHFYEKLLNLKARMVTSTAQEIAENRHEIMLDFLNKFYKEWNLTQDS